MNAFANRKLISLGAMLGAWLLSTPADAAPPAKDWLWPLYELSSTQPADQVATATPRPNVWTTNCEYQEFSDGAIPGLHPDLHPGIDIRGTQGDVVRFPETGTIVHLSHRDQCRTLNSGVYCRIWVATTTGDPEAADYIYYVGHLDFGHDPFSMVRADFRDKLVTAADAGGGPPASTVTVTKGDVAGQLENFSLGANGNWSHCHLGVYDRKNGFASMDPLAFLSENASGSDGSALYVHDDENPTIEQMTFVADDSFGVPTNVNPTGACGQELKGTLDITANIHDTFFTNSPAPNHFASDTLPPTTGILGASYSFQNLATLSESTTKQWYTSPLDCSGTSCGLFRVPFRAVDRALFTSNQGFFDWVDTVEPDVGAPVLAGGDFDSALYDPGPSANDHTELTTQPFIHILTNEVTESSGTGTNSAWHTEGLADGRYAVTVTAWDRAQNKSSVTQIVTVNNNGTATTAVGKGFQEIMVKDRDGDVGQTPSNPGDEPFWASDDIVVVDAGTGTPPLSQPARLEPVVVGQNYQVYVRVHNMGCQPMSGVTATVFSARAGTALEDLRSLSGGVYGGPSVSVPADPSNAIGGVAWAGPFDWTPTSDELGTDGHRCLVAAVTSSVDPGPALADAANWVIANDNNVAQRNLQITSLAFEIINPSGQMKDSGLDFDMGKFPVSGTPTFEFSIPYSSELQALWQGTPNTVVSQVGSDLVVQIKAGKVRLPTWGMPAVSQIPAKAKATGLPKGSGPYRVTVTHRLGGAIVGGMLFSLSGPPDEPPVTR